MRVDLKRAGKKQRILQNFIQLIDIPQNNLHAPGIIFYQIKFPLQNSDVNLD
jgi:hypothetical protein